MPVNVAEFIGLGQVGSQGAQVVGAPSATPQDITIGNASTAFGTNTRVIRVSSDTACRIAIGPAGTDAGVTAMYFPAGHVEYFAVAPDWILDTRA